MDELPGVDLRALEAWLDAECPGLRSAPLAGEVIAGGKSNLTYRITDGRRTWALRRPPLAHVLPTAHDMTREYRVISALADTDVPVPQPIALSAEPDVLGAPFYLMQYVDGVVLDQPDVLAAVDEAAARRSCELLIDTLVTLHDVDPQTVGLADFGRPAGFLARQVRRWHGQWQASETQPRTELAELVERLTAEVPEQSAPGIVHGDYRLTNVMIAPQFDRIAAVVDWEMATVGDPLADVGLLVVYHDLAADGSMVMPQLSPDRGFLPAADLVKRYRAQSQRSLDALDWYVAFGYFKLAVIAEGIHHRYLAGKTVGRGFDHFGPAVPMLLRRGLTALNALNGR
jgi:aminoglycoside phosphotransferase (APT) family kinase protein